MNKIIFLLTGSLMGALASCGPNYVFEQSYPISKQEWTYRDSLNFNFSIQDTSKVYNLYLDLEHSTDYSFQNLYVQIYTKFPSGKRLKEMVSLELADKAGGWYGDCGSKWCRLSIPIQEGAYFNAKGNYAITMAQYMRKNPLEGIKSIALKIEDAGTTRSSSKN